MKLASIGPKPLALLFVVAAALPAACSDDGETATTTATTTTSSAGGGSASSTSASGGGSVGGGTATSNSSSSGNAGGAGGTGGGGVGGDGGAGGGVAFTFFVTSVGNGTLGGNHGGLSGADAFCQNLAETAGVGAATWRAYLSTSTVDARDRIGTGPWTNFDGDVVATSVTDLHTNGLSNGSPQHMLDEYGQTVPMSEHDILTGSQADGTVQAGATCNDWTSSTTGQARVGHSDIPPAQFSPSWNSAHTVNGCSESALAAPLGSGRLYCFAE